jgi:ABC-type sugar transport system ATPase subunit
LGKELLRVENLSSPGRFKNISFSLNEGLVLGIAGLVGAGRTEIAQGIFGMDRSMTGGIFVDGKLVKIRNPHQAFALGIGLVTEDRKRFGIVPEMSCGHNLTLSTLVCRQQHGFVARAAGCPGCPERDNCLLFWDWLRLGQERKVVQEFFGRLRVRAASPDVAVSTLSGGNQQKVVLAKCLARQCRVLMLDEPTRGVDVGAKAEIHKLIDELAAAGHAVLMISSELPEILHLSTRILVMRQGQVAGVLSRAEATQERIMQLMAGRENVPEPKRGPHGS